MKLLRNHLAKAALFSFIILGASGVGAATATPQAAVTSAALAPGVFAKVGDKVITHDEYGVAFEAAARGKFYHGKPPEKEIALLQREVSDKLVTRILLLNEARRRGLHADAASVNKTVQGYEQRYADSAQWKKNRGQALPSLIAKLEQEDMLSQLETTVRASAKVDEKMAKVYYAAHQDKFTEPEQIRVSVILLKVDPSSPSATWVKVDEEAKALVKRARAGEDFAAMARQYSGDGSAPQGGDMGYVHSGMLPEGTQAVLGPLKNEQISDTLRLLEGVAFFRVTDRRKSVLHGFETVKVRAQALLQREQGNEAWAAFIMKLNAKTKVQVDQSRFLTLAK